MSENKHVYNILLLGRTSAIMQCAQNMCKTAQDSLVNDKKFASIELCCETLDENPLIIIGEARKILEATESLQEWRAPVVLLLGDDTWTEEVQSLLANVHIQLALVLRAADRNGQCPIRSEDQLQFTDVVKEQVRLRLRQRGDTQEESPENIKKLDWKCSIVAPKNKTGFISFFADPSTRALVQDLKDATRRMHAFLQANSTLWKKEEESPDTQYVLRPPSLLILGESGTGKTLVAQWIHDALGDVLPNKAKLCRLNIGAMAPDLVASELFGSSPGAFTGAVDRKGIFCAHKGGVVFLDEIGDINATVQVNLLQYLDCGRVRPLGADDSVFAPCVVTAATNRPLDILIKSDDASFRADLFYRFDAVVRIPALRQRRQDMRLIISACLQEIRSQLEALCDIVTHVSLDAIEFLESQHYEGNFRELQATLRRGMLHAANQKSTVLCLRHLML